MGISNKNDSNRIFVKFFFTQAKDCLGFVEDFFGSLIFEATLFNGILHFMEYCILLARMQTKGTVVMVQKESFSTEVMILKHEMV